MKFLLTILLFSLAVPTDTYTIKFTGQQIQKHFNNLNTIEQLIKESNLSYKQVMFCVGAIDSLKSEIYNQLPDSIKKK